MKKLINSYWPAVLWSAIVIILLCIPGSDLPDEASFFEIPFFDKWVHFGIFALLVTLWCWAISFKKPQLKLVKKFILITIASILLGYLMELVQKYLIPNRDYDLWDVLADGIGAVTGFLISLKVFIKK